MKGRLTLLVLLATLVAAGCIQPSSARDPSSPPPSTHNEGGNMTATEQKVAVACSGHSGRDHCASQKITGSGAFSGIARMDVDLRTFNGHITVKPGAAGSWSIVGTLKAYGASDDEAKANLARLTYSWRHTDGSSHFVQAEASKPDGDCCQDAEASIDVVVPSGVVMVVTAADTNGAIDIQGKTDGLSAETVNGQVSIDASVTSVSLRTTNGQVQARLVPTASGRISASTVNGQVIVSLPEDASHGYDAKAKTTNGPVEIGLKDGEKDTSACPKPSQYYTPPCTDLRFRTKEYASRAIQTSVTAEGTNGEVAIRSA